MDQPLLQKNWCLLIANNVIFLTHVTRMRITRYKLYACANVVIIGKYILEENYIL